MDHDDSKASESAFESPTFGQDGSFRLDKPVGSASISPCGRDIVLASRQGLHIIDLDSPWSPPRHLTYHTPWEVADVQWSPFATRDSWVVSTSNQKALVWNLNLSNPQASVEHILHGHTRAISDINFSAFHPDILATCAVDSFVHCWDLRHPAKPAMSFCDWFAGATQVKWNRQNSHILSSSHDRFLRIWDDRKGAQPLRSIEAHATKIYGIDWNRIETRNLVTCSLDKTIKFWDYSKDTDEPEQVIRTPFPVWRARHTPFGYGLLAMPQRGDNNVHLYDQRAVESRSKRHFASPVQSFVGHNDQVKEFLWRTRGAVSETMDSRDFQLVTWGADKVLRLHHLHSDILEDVGYQKGMEVKRTMGFTRKGATYRSFREKPHTDEERYQPLQMTHDSHSGSKMNPQMTTESGTTAPFVGGKTIGRSSRRKALDGRKETDPITWMRGVRIGKRSNLPDLQESVSTVMSPSVKADPSWERFESLGEEITHLGERFSKIKFDQIDVTHRKIGLLLSGPWGPERSSTYLKTRLEFPKEYPLSALPQVHIEKTASLDEDSLNQILEDIETIATNFLTLQRSSLEAIVRFLIGEQNLEESLQLLQKHRRSEDLTASREPALSSSDEEDEDMGAFVHPQSDSMVATDPVAVQPLMQYNLPIPSTCGARWAGNGTLVCFFDTKQKEPSIFNQSLGTNDRSLKSRDTLFEGFGKLNDALSRRKRPRSALDAADDDDSGDNEYPSSSSDSSLSSTLSLTQNYFMPAMAWQGDGFESFPKLSLDDSQKSSGEVGAGGSTTTKSSSFITLAAYQDLLPVKAVLAQNYSIGSGSHVAIHNASVAREYGFSAIADAWSFLALIVQDQVPLMTAQTAIDGESILMLARRSLSPLKSMDSAIDLSYDADTENFNGCSRGKIKWGGHPLGRGWLIDALFAYFERRGDVQMLAMMSCVLESSPELMKTNVSASGSFKSTGSSVQHHDRLYYPSLAVAASLFGAPVSHQRPKLTSGPHSATSSAGASMVEQTIISPESNTPPSYIPFRNAGERRSSQGTSLSTSPEHNRHFHRSSSNHSGFGASFTRPFSFISSAASSPPSGFPRKRLSPSGPYLGVTTQAAVWPSAVFSNKSANLFEDQKGSFSHSISDVGEETHSDMESRPRFNTTLKNQEMFHIEGFANIPILDSKTQSRNIVYREIYAHILDVWNLQTACCEILQFNPAQFATQSEAPDIAHHFTYDSNEEQLSNLALEIQQVCSRCLYPQRLLPETPHCLRCRQPLSSPQCLFCHSRIRGQASPCFGCNHILHERCRQILLESDIQECPSGCGCICADHVSVELKQPPLPHSPKLFSHDLRPRRRGQSANAYTRDVSPAITVVADPDARTTSPQPQPQPQPRRVERGLKGMRRGSDLGPSAFHGRSSSMTERSEGGGGGGDVAYESLARNLWGGAAAIVGASGGGGGADGGGRATPTPTTSGITLRERGSQIWRGGGG